MTEILNAGAAEERGKHIHAGSFFNAAGERPETAEHALGVPLVISTRGQWAENIHSGHVVAVSEVGDIIAHAGSADVWTFARSTAKPVQAMSSVLGAVLEAYGLDNEELALMTASHQGEEMHMEVLERMLTRTGVKEAELAFGPALPSGSEARGKLLRSELLSRRWSSFAPAGASPSASVTIFRRKS
ncbi:asparaginase [Paenibacillus sp. sptzw28]|uniref:asparaginase n=1 Tax=Paenibacillus sp. sptzw28 TaxID=715179 RepID=UPI002163FB00|nr:asparaginase [Paenibacillus sp. sptzw28]